jgi:predicted NBD/HSP70 family sugar kinase
LSHDGTASDSPNPLDGVVLLSGGTDGEDGPTDAAGAVIDAALFDEMRRRKLDPQDYLGRNDAYRFFDQLGGLILDGKLYAGEGMAGEVGHIVVDPSGIACGCGSRGCVETLASATAAKRRAVQAGLPSTKPGDLRLLAERARAGHTPEKKLLHDVGLDLGRGIAPVISLLDLHVFVFGGGFSAALDTMEDGIRAGAKERSYGARRAELKFVHATLGPSAGWIGAARPTVAMRRA